MRPEIEYLPDDSINDAVDLELRGLLTACFKKPQDYVFEERRYFKEPYPHRWVIRDDAGAFVAHVGVHVKNVEFDGKSFPVGGICEVCVHPDYRGRGYVRMMLEQIHKWLAEHDFVFSMLFGDPGIYSSSGYAPVSNLFSGSDAEGWTPVQGMVLALGDTPWPACEVHLPGIKF